MWEPLPSDRLGVVRHRRPPLRGLTLPVTTLDSSLSRESSIASINFKPSFQGARIKQKNFKRWRGKLGFTTKSTPAKKSKLFLRRRFALSRSARSGGCSPYGPLTYTLSGTVSGGRTKLAVSLSERTFPLARSLPLSLLSMCALGFLLSIYQFRKTHRSTVEISFGRPSASRFRFLGRNCGFD